MKKWRGLMVGILVICLAFTGVVPLTVQAVEDEGTLVEGFIGGACSLEDSLAENEDSIVSATPSSNISGINFSYADVRTPSNARTFNGGDGKYHILIYGGVGSCGNTNSAIINLSRLTAFMDLSQVEMNVFDIKNNSNDMITGMLSSNSISADIKVCKSRGDANLYASCCQAAGVGTDQYTMPIVAYVNTYGDIVKATTGYTTTVAMQNNIESMGLRVDIESSYQVLNLTGIVDYTAAYQVLDLVNKDRAAAGLPALTMDPGLLETAMQRAAEVALYNDHQRPNGENCYSIDSQMYAENIAIGYRSAADAEKGWMGSVGHKSNILSKDAGSIGIGVFCVNNIYFWVQCFGRQGSANTIAPANATRTYSIQTSQTYVDPFLKNAVINFSKKDEKASFEVWVNNKTTPYVSVRVDASSYNWGSDNANFVVDPAGVVTAKKWGHAEISIINKNNSNYNLLGEVNLSTKATASNPGIFLAEVSRTQIVAGMTYKVTEATDMEFCWALSSDGTNWSWAQGWKENDEWFRWTPDTYGDWQLKCYARVQGNPSSLIEDTIPLSFHPAIKGKCQMPYTGEGGGYLIGVETYDNPNQSYTYEMLILDCTLLAQGKDAWIYTTGRCGVAEGNALWTVWQPQYGYYWTLFRIYDASGNMIDEACYGFQNI